MEHQTTTYPEDHGTRVVSNRRLSGAGGALRCRAHAGHPLRVFDRRPPRNSRRPQPVQEPRTPSRGCMVLQVVVAAARCSMHV